MNELVNSRVSSLMWLDLRSICS